VIYPAINLPTQDLEDTFQALRKELQLPAESKVVSLVGRIQEWKGQEYFVKAIPKILDKVPDAYFLAVGDCTFEQDYPYYDRLLKLADELCLQSRIRFTGFREDIPKIMRLSDVIVHASIRPEPFGLVIIEGMASGKSVIATDMGGPKEIITDGVDGLLIPPKDENAISDAVIRILQDKSLGMRLAENAKTTVKEKFSIERCILKMEKHLESLFLK
jgi:glycosyltransferase involved in cell wall biosynthesis